MLGRRLEQATCLLLRRGFQNHLRIGHDGLL
jgi:hypothetical protein